MTSSVRFARGPKVTFLSVIPESTALYDKLAPTNNVSSQW